MKKDIEWLKEKLLEELTQFNDNPNLRTVYETGIADGIVTAINLTEKLDEPEVEEKFYTFDNAKKWLQDNGFVVFEKDKLYSEVQQMISETYKAKKDKPVIPKFVADWIEEYKSIGLHCAMKDLYGNKDYDNVARWLYHNDRETNLEKEKMLMRAWLDDYDVEVEKVYQVRDKNDTILCKVYGKVMIVGKAWCIGYGQEVYNLTEKEIKDYDERYWVFAEEV